MSVLCFQLISGAPQLARKREKKQLMQILAKGSYQSVPPSHEVSTSCMLTEKMLMYNHQPSQPPHLFSFFFLKERYIGSFLPIHSSQCISTFLSCNYSTAINTLNPGYLNFLLVPCCSSAVLSEFSLPRCNNAASGS